MLFMWLLCVILSTVCMSTVSGELDPQCHHNCTCCKNEECGQGTYFSDTCLKGCIDGHRGARCYELCQYENCKSCGGTGDDKVCTECFDGYYLGSNKDCTSQCLSNCKACTSSTMCTECKEGFYDKECTSLCPSNCKSCTSSTMCTKCKEGFYDKNCTSQCPSNCKSCTSSTMCTECKGGFYDKNCTSQCPSNCKSCTSSTRCTECKEGFYDKDGSTTCKYAHCPANCECNGQGDCISCKKGYYDNNTSCIKCPVNCVTCETVESCNECEIGFYNGYELDNNKSLQLNNCTYLCRQSCTQCQSYNKCSQCTEGKYGSTCMGNCSVGCKDKTCLIDSGQCECKEDFTGDKCMLCVSGKYGLFCNQSCPKYCKGNTCERTSGVCTGCSNDNITGSTCEICITGMYGELCDTMCPDNCPNNRCERPNGTCSEACIGNFDGPFCDVCIHGKYGQNCKKNCSVNCAGGICGKISGTCSSCIGNFVGKTCNECYPGYYSQECNKNCSQFCNNKSCDRTSGVCVYGCTHGYSGDKCCVNTENCVECYNNTECRSCDPGYYKKACNERCPEGCLGPCEISTGKCSNCKNNRFGLFCELNCSDSCKFEDSIRNRACAKSDGKCYRCHDGYFGPTCNATCSRLCTNTICRQSDGVCINGCEGLQKEPECALGQANTRLTTDPTPSTSIVGPVVGGIAGVLLLLAGVVAAVLFYRRRQRRQDSDRSNEYHKRTSLKTKTDNAGIAGDGYENENSRGNEQVRNTLNLETEEEDEEVVVIDEESENEPDDNDYYNYTSVKVANLFSYVTKDHVDLFERDFKNLPKRDKSSTLCKIAKRPENAASNRYAGIYPFDTSRVTIPGEPTFYINASYIDGYNRDKAYIASLGPTKSHMHNFTTFWRMVWHEKSDIIVMLTNLHETTGMKCEQYWPEIEQSYGQINVKCRSVEEFAEYTVKCFTLTKGKEERNLTQLQFTVWPDRGVPSDVTSLVEFRQRVKATARVLDGPVIVHCSAGVGRTGTYIALDILSEQGKAEHSVDVFNCVTKLRGQRVNMVQTAEQYIFLHKALVHTLTFGCEALPAEELQSLAFDSEKTFTKMFQTLKKEVDSEREEEIAARKENKRIYAGKCRRYSDIPGNRGRVRLFLHRESGNHDFINAVFINSFKLKDLFIVAQTPQSNTVEDFLCMIYQQNSSCVIALEDPLQLSKKHDVGIYLPADNETFTCGEFTVTSSKFENKPQYTIKKLAIKHTDKGVEKIAYHFQYTKWVNDRTVAESPVDFVQFVRDIETYVKQREKDAPNVLVHCLNGFEKSCLFCIVYTLLEKLEAEGQVSVVNVIRKIRAQRKLSVTSVEQLKFCFQCTSAYMESFKTYSNFAT